MKINLLINKSESLTKGPGRRAANLMLGFDRQGIAYEICSNDYENAFGMQGGAVFAYWKDLPSYTPIGPNVIHEASAHLDIAAKFKNFVVQSEWVKNYWLWENKDLTAGYTFHVYPASVDTIEWNVKSNREKKCLFYTKYQSGENCEGAREILRKRGHSSIEINYGEYTPAQLKEACSKVEYCLFNSCCEKSSNALLEIMACDIPVYVIDSKRWIGNDKFDQCSSAPDFSEICGVKESIEWDAKDDVKGKLFDSFYDNVKANIYKPREFILDGYTVEKMALRVKEILELCHA